MLPCRTPAAAYLSAPCSVCMNDVVKKSKKNSVSLAATLATECLSEIPAAYDACVELKLLVLSIASSRK